MKMRKASKGLEQLAALVDSMTEEYARQDSKMMSAVHRIEECAAITRIVTDGMKSLSTRVRGEVAEM